MYIKKLVIAFGTLTILGMLLSACQPAGPTPQAAEKPEIIVASTASLTAIATRAVAGGLMCIIVPPIENPYFDSQQELIAQKAEELGYTALKFVHDDDLMKQNELIDRCVDQQAVAIILNNADADASVSSIQKAKEAGVPTFLIDREINQGEVAVSQIVFNHYQGAILAAQEFSRLMSGEGEYIEVTRSQTDSSSQNPSRGFQAVLGTLPNMEMVAKQTIGWSANDVDDVEILLRDHPNVKGFICASDTLALAVQAALDLAGRSEVIVVSFGGSESVNQSIMNGKIDAVVLQPVFEMATQAVLQADRYLRTGSTGRPEKQLLDMILITPANACMYTAFAPNGKTSCP